jgi:hypothetical protein
LNIVKEFKKLIYKTMQEPTPVDPTQTPNPVVANSDPVVEVEMEAPAEEVSQDETPVEEAPVEETETVEEAPEVPTDAEVADSAEPEVAPEAETSDESAAE